MGVRAGCAAVAIYIYIKGFSFVKNRSYHPSSLWPPLKLFTLDSRKTMDDDLDFEEVLPAAADIKQDDAEIHAGGVASMEDTQDNDVVNPKPQTLKS